MNKKLGFIRLFQALKERIETGTPYPLLDAVEVDRLPPFYIGEFSLKEQSNTKNMYCETFYIEIHAISEAGQSKEQLYELIELLEDAMTEDIVLPPCFIVISQESEGAYDFVQEASGEWRATVPFQIRIAYGFKSKN